MVSSGANPSNTTEPQAAGTQSRSWKWGDSSAWGIAARSVTVAALIGGAIAMTVRLASEKRLLRELLVVNEMPPEPRQALLVAAALGVALGALVGVSTLVRLSARGWQLA